MTSVVTRTIRAVPFRSARDAWRLIIDILTAAGGAAHRSELDSVAGIAAAVITEKSPEQAPIVVVGGGPRVRIYCLYDESALEADTQNEQSLSFDPLGEDWTVSLPCPSADLTWVTAALGKKTLRVQARNATDGIAVPVEKDESAFELSVGEFMRS
jgi:hypothetical protein